MKRCECVTDDRTPPEGWSGFRFCLVDGEVWACWQHSDSEVKLGSLEDAAAAILDFQCQTEVGYRLNGLSSKN